MNIKYMDLSVEELFDCFFSFFLTSIALCNASDQQPETLKQLVEMYDPTDCRECHEQIYAQWQNSHHARSISGIFIERYLKIGPLSVKDSEDATKKNFPSFKCHLPQLEKATDAVAGEIARVILNNDKTTMKKLNISCMACRKSTSCMAPDRFYIIVGLIALAGVLIIMYWSRS